MILAPALRKIIRHGHLVITSSVGRRYEFGDKFNKGTRVAIRFHNRRAEWQILLRPHLALGEAYMNGDVSFEDGDINDLLFLLTQNIAVNQSIFLPDWTRPIRRGLKRLHQYNPIWRGKQNVAHHYDLSGQLYDLFLDLDRQYSCGYFRHERDTLEDAQGSKKRHLASKLRLEPGHRVLDIGSGWGGLATYLAEETGANVTGITQSEEQFKESMKFAEGELSNGCVAFALSDYRKVQGEFDRIVSVGMFEHVGVNHYSVFFKKVSDLLVPDGIAVIHSIGRSSPPTYTNPWTRKYIFPGGYMPALSEVLCAVEQTGLWVTDIEILRLHYAQTLKKWRARFLANWDKISDLYDERFCRMWDYYLSSAEVGFRNQDLMVFQIQLAKCVDAVPLTRDYMFDWERQKLAQESTPKLEDLGKVARVGSWRERKRASG